MRKDTAVFVRNCLQCQRSKVQQHTRSTPAKYEPTKERFSHINIDIVGPFPLCEGQRYCLTVIDRFTRWPEAVPIPDMSADTVVKALLSQWISRFGVPARVTSDRGRQFESSVFTELINTIGATHLRTTPYHPQSNGIIERWHRTFKAAILCHNPARWVYHLPTILLGLRVSFKPDLKASPAELVYGSTLTIPGEFFHHIKTPDSSSDFISDFREAMQKLKPTDTAHHSTPRTFVSKNLQNSSHVFVRNDSIRPSLSHPYHGPYPILKRFDKYFTIMIRGRQSNISIDRLKPAFTENNNLNDGSSVPEVPIASPDSIIQQIPNNKNLNSSPTVSFPPELTQPKATSSGRRVAVPLRFR